MGADYNAISERERRPRERLKVNGLPGNDSREYKTWESMMGRCANKSHHKYARYGGRGISVCKAWVYFSGFYADMGPRPEGMTLGRIDNDKDYCAENCRWETPKQQQNNTRRTRWIDVEGRRLAFADAARHYGVSPKVALGRVNSHGWPPEEAVRTPAFKIGGRRPKP